MELSPTPVPPPREYVDTVKDDVMTLPDGRLFIQEEEYWSKVHERAAQAGSASNLVIAGLLRVGLRKAGIQLVEFNKFKNSPASLIKRSQQLREWYRQTGQLFGASRLLRAFFDDSLTLEDDGEPVLASEAGIDIQYVGIDLASLAIQATGVGMEQLGLQPYRRHRENWYRHEGVGAYIRATSPASPSARFRADFREANRRNFDNAASFSINAFLMAREWAARHTPSQ